MLFVLQCLKLVQEVVAIDVLQILECLHLILTQLGLTQVPKKRFLLTSEEGEEEKCTLDVLYSKSQGGSRVG